MVATNDLKHFGLLLKDITYWGVIKLYELLGVLFTGYELLKMLLKDMS